MSERFDANPNNLDIGADLPHVSRYLLARGFIKSGEMVVDAACGPGYGSYLLSEVAGKVIALDYQNVFSSRWKNDKITFIQLDLEKDVFFPDICDVWVSLETIEHLYNPQAYLDKVTKVTRRAMIFSSDNHESVGLNEFHHTNVLINNMRQMMNKYLEWMEYNSFFQGRENGQWILIYVKKDSKWI